jgi:hypothetical protein
MFRSSTILRELVQNLSKDTLLLKHSVKLRLCVLCGNVAACRETACVLFVVQTAVCTTNSKHPRCCRPPVGNIDYPQDVTHSLVLLKMGKIITQTC